MQFRRHFTTNMAILVSMALMQSVFTLCSTSRAGEPTPADPNTIAATASTNQAEATVALTAKIDTLIEAGWRENKAEPAPMADDAEFMRRTYLNLAGKIPPVFEVRRFLADTAPDKRRQLVDRLLEGPAFIAHFTNIYRAELIPESDSDFQLRGLIPGFEAWLRDQLIDNVGYDKIIRELVTYPITTGANTGPAVFYRAKSVKPENLAAATSRLFLGVRLECAQCHDHPFAKWKQDEFWSFAAFYSGLEGERFGQITDNSARREIKLPETEKLVQAKYLDGREPTWTRGAVTRNVLADWLTSAENPYFARAGANRVWAYLMGIGIVDPVDDFDISNPASHPELLDELARQYAAQGFDLKFLIRAITASKAYQLTSRQTHVSQDDPRLFARMSVKGLTPEQLFESLAQATGYYDNIDFRNRIFQVNPNGPRGMVRQLFDNSESSPTETQTTILQSLALMNGQFIAGQTNPSAGSTLAAVIESPFLTRAEQVEALYLAALSRKPNEAELQRMVEYVEAGGSKNKKRPGRIAQTIRALLPQGARQPDPQSIAMGDVFWALLNSSEFILNH